jgi:hypothetical protein
MKNMLFLVVSIILTFDLCFAASGYDSSDDEYADIDALMDSVSRSRSSIGFEESMDREVSTPAGVKFSKHYTEADFKKDSEQASIEILAASMNGGYGMSRERLSKFIEYNKPNLEMRDVSVHRGTALIYAAINGRLEFVEVLLKIGRVNINHEDAHGQTALINGARFCQADIIEILLGFGAREDIVPTKGPGANKSALHYLTQCPPKEGVSKLVTQLSSGRSKSMSTSTRGSSVGSSSSRYEYSDFDESVSSSRGGYSASRSSQGSLSSESLKSRMRRKREEGSLSGTDIRSLAALESMIKTREIIGAMESTNRGDSENATMSRRESVEGVGESFNLESSRRREDRHRRRRKRRHRRHLYGISMGGDYSAASSSESTQDISGETLNKLEDEVDNTISLADDELVISVKKFIRKSREEDKQKRRNSIKQTWPLIKEAYSIGNSVRLRDQDPELLVAKRDTIAPLVLNAGEDHRITPARLAAAKEKLKSIKRNPDGGSDLRAEMRLINKKEETTIKALRSSVTKDQVVKEKSEKTWVRESRKKIEKDYEEEKQGLINELVLKLKARGGSKSVSDRKRPSSPSSRSLGRAYSIDDIVAKDPAETVRGVKNLIELAEKKIGSSRNLQEREQKISAVLDIITSLTNRGGRFKSMKPSRKYDYGKIVSLLRSRSNNSLKRLDRGASAAKSFRPSGPTKGHVKRKADIFDRKLAAETAVRDFLLKQEIKAEEEELKREKKLQSDQLKLVSRIVSVGSKDPRKGRDPRVVALKDQLLHELLAHKADGSNSKKDAVKMNIVRRKISILKMAKPEEIRFKMFEIEKESKPLLEKAEKSVKAEVKRQTENLVKEVASIKESIISRMVPLEQKVQHELVQGEKAYESKIHRPLREEVVKAVIDHKMNMEKYRIKEDSKWIETADFKLHKEMDCLVKKSPRTNNFLLEISYLKFDRIKQTGRANSIWFVNKKEESVGLKGGKRCPPGRCADYAIFHSGRAHDKLYLNSLYITLGPKMKDHFEIYSSNKNYDVVRVNITQCKNYGLHAFPKPGRRR